MKIFRIILPIILLSLLCSLGLYFALDKGILWFVYPSETQYPIRGIDVSNHQGKIDWKKIPENKIRFVYIKATEGGDWKDKSFSRNWEEASSIGLRVGAYHFFTLCRSGKEQAENFISYVPKDPKSLPPVADLEFVGNCKERPPMQDVKKEISDFLNILENHYKKKPILYLTYEFIDLYLKDDFLEYPVWIRDIFGHPPSSFKRNWIIWQYHSRAKIKGVEGPVDLNVLKGDDLFLKKL
ncbi:GH25 family lysozyme [Leptospira sp. WS58.C1]|uniref:glycoside hydrolase family 25 protein n=1 Tax=Leptospira TaxID=171 RepID=UPI0002BEC7D3|nr:MULTISPECIES: GH25 family lysozyme [unclassified Leptospira]EMK00025.1 glycosyl hydrolase family 25 [Leptospira sp. B5-022]MCR1792048.1 glycoside hydrolase family 25 protein [Leptospira sp. id769339]